MDHFVEHETAATTPARFVEGKGGGDMAQDIRDLADAPGLDRFAPGAHLN